MPAMDRGIAALPQPLRLVLETARQPDKRSLGSVFVNAVFFPTGETDMTTAGTHDGDAELTAGRPV